MNLEIRGGFGLPHRVLSVLLNWVAHWSDVPISHPEIVFSGLRPGEKMYEELFQTSENHERTVQKKIFVATEKAPKADNEMEGAIIQLIQLARQVKSDDVVAGIRQLVPMTYPSPMVSWYVWNFWLDWGHTRWSSIPNQTTVASALSPRPRWWRIWL